MSVNESGSDEEENDEKPLGIYSNDKPLYNNSIIGDSEANEAELVKERQSRRVTFVT